MNQPLRYRTFIRVSFEEEEQRSKPSDCWEIRKKGRGLTEAHRYGGKFQAVEFAEPAGTSNYKDRQVQDEKASFDGFCITWTAKITAGASNCSIFVRFNFLSTNFSHSKGVKEITVRLCAKTESLSSEADSESINESEVCYCKIKVFRGHGVERKSSNDIAHVKKF
ncbi:CP2 transcription factor [Penicillium sp. IBT 35674x]|nr:CP2 transcription factor [Penicillium sp. IBT 35674x]